MFRGINAINVDVKGRLSVPTRYRQRLVDTAQRHLVLTIDTESPCLLLYPLYAWEEIEAQIAALPSFNAAARRVQRLLLGHATEVDMDSHGRILLPPLLREYASLDRKVILLGQGKKFELWNEEDWHKQREHWLNEGKGGDELPDDFLSISL
jgi:MraZ protein